MFRNNRMDSNQDRDPLLQNRNRGRESQMRQYSVNAPNPSGPYNRNNGANSARTIMINSDQENVPDYSQEYVIKDGYDIFRVTKEDIISKNYIISD